MLSHKAHSTKTVAHQKSFHRVRVIPPSHSPAAEYEALREELLVGKKYVFERPLLIITISVAAANFTNEAHLAYLPPIVIGLMVFNLWFTVNRMHSIARIVAYVQIELEERKWEPWLGWETCLRHFRLWINRNHSTRHSLMKARFDNNAVPDAIGYYPMIFYMHIAVVALLFLVSVRSVFADSSFANIALLLVTFAISVVFTYTACRWRPRSCKNLIEQNRVCWEYVFEGLERDGIRKSRQIR